MRLLILMVANALISKNATMIGNKIIGSMARFDNDLDRMPEHDKKNHNMLGLKMVATSIIVACLARSK